MQLEYGPAIAFFKREVLTSMRKGTVFAALGAYVAIVVFALSASWPEGTTALISAGRYSRQLLGTWTLASVWAIVLILPTLAANSIISEKQKNTLDLLYTVPVAPINIIVGKFLGVISFFVFLLIVSCPLLGITFFLVGLDWTQLLLWMAVVAPAVFAAAALSLRISVTAPNMNSALGRIYGAAFLLYIGLAICAGLSSVFLRTFFAYQFSYWVIVCLFLLFLTFLYLGTAANAWRRLPRTMEQKNIDPKTLNVLVRPIGESFDKHKPLRDGRNPVFLKEIYWGARQGGGMRARIIAYSIIIYAFSIFSVVFMSLNGRRGNPDYSFLSFHAVLPILFSPAFMASMFTKEYETGNMDTLRLTPLRPREIVLGKWYAGLHAIRPFLYASLAMTFIVFLAWRRLDIVPIALGYASFIICSIYAVTSGLLASLVMRSTGTAAALGYALISPLAFFSLLRRVLQGPMTYWMGPFSGWLISSAICAALSAIMLWLAVLIYAWRHAKDSDRKGAA